MKNSLRCFLRQDSSNIDIFSHEKMSFVYRFQAVTYIFQDSLFPAELKNCSVEILRHGSGF